MSGAALVMKLFGASIRAQMQYPASAAMLTLGQFLATVLEIVGVWALFDRFGQIRGWSLGEVCVFYGLVNIAFSFADLVTRGFDIFGSEFVKTGAFDRVLLRPRSTVLQLVGHEFRLSRFGRTAQGLGVLVLGVQLSGAHWSVVDTGLALFAIAGGMALFAGLVVLQATLAFWTVESLEVANVLTYGGVQAAHYPLSIYATWFRRFLTFVVPIACVAYYPVVAILDRADPTGAPAWVGPAAPLAGFAFLAVSLWAWRFGVGRYTSTGS
ncbi:ABC transporter permease [Phenylobacterium sp.]|uniref:ABC transporter permease n=1 Tax=Phenylobacterium sp. TaxID=1871053 RepID=UPI002E314F43|nr:ABC-2 family transporter protein [Phenylobacterium sp.]HEX2560508.1 ABC-2 family transporter protein [Phenylobacterium sp.]